MSGVGTELKRTGFCNKIEVPKSALELKNVINVIICIRTSKGTNLHLIVILYYLNFIL